MKIYKVHVQESGFPPRVEIKLVEVEARETDKLFIIARTDEVFFGWSTRVPKEDHYRSPRAAIEFFCAVAKQSKANHLKAVTAANDRIMVACDMLAHLEEGA